MDDNLRFLLKHNELYSIRFWVTDSTCDWFWIWTNIYNFIYVAIRNWIAAYSPGMLSIRSLEIMTNDFADFLILYTKKLKDFHEICTIIDISIFFRNVLKKGYYENGEKEGLTLLRSVQAYFSLFTCCGVVLQRHIWSLIILLTAIKKAFPAQSN